MSDIPQVLAWQISHGGGQGPPLAIMLRAMAHREPRLPSTWASPALTTSATNVDIMAIMNTQNDAIHTVIFDLGGVYFSDGTKRAVKVLSSRFDLDEREVSDQLIGKLGSEWRMGKLTAEQFWAKFKDRWKLTVSSDELSLIWFEGYELDRGTERVVTALSAA